LATSDLITAPLGQVYLMRISAQLKDGNTSKKYCKQEFILVFGLCIKQIERAFRLAELAQIQRAFSAGINSANTKIDY
jgi:hypothetical protein